jgi:sterol 14-demethylase
MADALALAALCAGALALLLALRFMALRVLTRVQRAPPLDAGVLPFLGAFFAFASEQPAEYIRRRAARFRSCFSTYVLGRSMTFLVTAESFSTFFTNTKELSFSEATLPFLSSGFGIGKRAYLTVHEPLLDRVRGILSPPNLREHYCDALSRALSGNLYRWIGDGAPSEQRLMALVRRAIFWSSAMAIFGPGIVDHETLEDDFERFDDGFELACSGLPGFMVRPFRAARARVSSALFDSVTRASKPSASGAAANKLCAQEALEVVSEKWSGASDDDRRAWLLAILWALEANTIPACFWVLTLLARHQEIAARVRSQVDEMLSKLGASRGDHGEFAVSYAALQEPRLLHKCVREAVRLHPPTTIVRKTVAPLEVDGKVVPAGHLVMLAMAVAHRDARFFPEPERFNPDRWDDRLELISPPGVAAGEPLPPFCFAAFGGGRYRCPGRFMAEMEIALLVAAVLARYELELVGDAPQPRLDRLVGVAHPRAEATLRFVPRRARA